MLDYSTCDMLIEFTIAKRRAAGERGADGVEEEDKVGRRGFLYAAALLYLLYYTILYYHRKKCKKSEPCGIGAPKAWLRRAGQIMLWS